MNISHISPKNIPAGAGVDCRYYEVDAEKGAKLYRDEYTRTKCYWLQKFAFRHNLGPAVYGCFELDVEGQTWYGFITEIVTVAANRVDVFAEWPADEYTMKDWWSDVLYDNGQYKKDIATDLREKFREWGVYACDTHLANLGIDKLGRGCVIDFGHFELMESTSEEFNEWRKSTDYETIYGQQLITFLEEKNVV